MEVISWNGALCWNDLCILWQKGKVNMITINDNDLPITVAQKIVNGTKVVELSPAMKSLQKSLTGNEDNEYDMFELEEIKEIAEYLLVYYNNHPQGD